MLKRLLTGLARFAAGALLLWLTALLILAFCRLPLAFSDREAMQVSLAAAAVAFLVFLKVPLVPVYVFGHECTHWLLAKCFRRRTSRFNVRFASGSVRVERPNIWIILGPYIIPLYLVLFAAVFFPLNACVALPRPCVLAGLALTGVLYAYHLALTAIALNRNQPDLDFNGPCFSLVFILFFNVLFLCLALVAATGNFREAAGALADTVAGQIEFIRKIIWWNSIPATVLP